MCDYDVIYHSGEPDCSYNACVGRKLKIYIPRLLFLLVYVYVHYIYKTIWEVSRLWNPEKQIGTLLGGLYLFVWLSTCIFLLNCTLLHKWIEIFSCFGFPAIKTFSLLGLFSLLLQGEVSLGLYFIHPRIHSAMYWSLFFTLTFHVYFVLGFSFLFLEVFWRHILDVENESSTLLSSSHTNNRRSKLNLTCAKLTRFRKIMLFVCMSVVAQSSSYRPHFTGHSQDKNRVSSKEPIL